MSTIVPIDRVRDGAAGAVILAVCSLAACGGRVVGDSTPDAAVVDNDAGIVVDATVDTAAATDVVAADTSFAADTFLDVSPAEGSPDTAIDAMDVAVDAFVPPPTVTHISGSLSYSSATSCMKSGTCSHGDSCWGTCNTCSCDSPGFPTPGMWRCSTSICPSTGSGCPLRLPHAFDPCSGDIVCEYSTACEGRRHRVACVNGSFRVTYAMCAPRCPPTEPAADSECFAESLFCAYPGDYCDRHYTCRAGRWFPNGKCPGIGTAWPCYGGMCGTCPTTMPLSGTSCGADSKVGENCIYAPSTTSASYALCLCMGGSWACYDKRPIGPAGLPPPGAEQPPDDRCANSAWCTGIGACCGSTGAVKLGCDCKASGMVCGEGESC
jgi:hypothetical protein